MRVNVSLRPLIRADLPTLHRWRNDPAVTRHLARRKMSQAQLEAWFEGLERGDGEAHAIIADGDFTGYGVLEHVDRANRKCEAGIVIGEPQNWGQGIGTQVARQLAARAFGWLEMHRILAVASAENPASIACFKAAGFQEEGRLREASLQNGVYVDLILLSLLKTEWRPPTDNLV